MTILDYIKTIQSNFLPTPESCIPSEEIESVDWFITGIGENAIFYNEDTLHLQVAIIRTINVFPYDLVFLFYKNKRGQIDQFLTNLTISYPGLKNKLNIYNKKIIMEELLNLHDFTNIECEILSYKLFEKHEI